MPAKETDTIKERRLDGRALKAPNIVKSHY